MGTAFNGLKTLGSLLLLCATVSGARKAKNVEKVEPVKENAESPLLPTPPEGFGELLAPAETHFSNSNYMKGPIGHQDQAFVVTSGYKIDDGVLDGSFGGLRHTTKGIVIDVDNGPHHQTKHHTGGHISHGNGHGHSYRSPQGRYPSYGGGGQYGTQHGFRPLTSNHLGYGRGHHGVSAVPHHHGHHGVSGSPYHGASHHGAYGHPQGGFGGGHYGGQGLYNRYHGGGGIRHHHGGHRGSIGYHPGVQYHRPAYNVGGHQTHGLHGGYGGVPHGGSHFGGAGSYQHSPVHYGGIRGYVPASGPYHRPVSGHGVRQHAYSPAVGGGYLYGGVKPQGAAAFSGFSNHLGNGASSFMNSHLNG